MATTTSVHDVIRAIRQGTIGKNRDRGTRFEELMLQYLSTDPQWSEQFSRVWMWADWPGAEHDKRDTGIDLVAQDRETGGFCAIQCKFYEPQHTIQKEDIDSFFTASGKGGFTRRMIVSTTEKWGVHAEAALDDQQIPVTRLGLSDIAHSPVEWQLPAAGQPIELALQKKKEPRRHQSAAIADVFAGFAQNKRGKLIMACGTGKTFTGLKIVERLQKERAAAGAGEHTSVLFLVPSIALLSQTLREWSFEAEVPLRPFAVCSDVKVGKQQAKGDDGDMATHDLALPATTDPNRLIQQMANVEAAPGLTVVFSTYQSIATVSEAQKKGLPRFDLILCDEAHRTTGVTLAGHDESAFVRVHDDAYLGADRRLYMTATPRIYNEDTKADAKNAAAVLASMDNEQMFGPEFHRLGFGQAVEQGLLTDYKVLILTIDEGVVAKTLQQGIAGGSSELNLDDVAKIIGCWNAMAKRTGTFADGSGFAEDEAPMKRAVAFARSIPDSKAIADRFKEVVDAYDDADDDVLHCDVNHVDGTFNTLERNRLLDWLKQDPGQNQARILSNVRCLSEGVDVPSLDAVLFLHPRNSVVDVVQSVGRVMRLAPGKNYGYIILPVTVPAGMPPEKALADNQRFKTVWQVLQALRAHDDRFNATVNQIELNKNKPDNKIGIGSIGPNDETIGDQDGSSNSDSSQAAKDKEAQSAQHIQDALFSVSDWRDAIYARIVDKVGERHYWEDWAKDIAQIADRHVTRIKAALAIPEKQTAFQEFVGELRATINPGVTDSDAIDMLAQHIVTKPVFDALFKDYGFAEQNPVSKAMQRMLDILDDQGLDDEAKTLESFYHSVRVRAEGIDNHEGRQRVIVELYDKFFKTALPKTADALGIVYTPIEVVDFIVRATEKALAKHLGRSLSDEGVQIIDPFVGTGTFPVRLLQSGLIKPEDLLRKYTRELHANEIVLLAYYIAAVNIEAAFHDLVGGDYQPFEGIVLTDTFQLAEGAAKLDGMDVLEGNSERAKKQQKQGITVVVGNPPYSVGQDSQNDNNQNLKYDVLDERIQQTYAALSTATNKNSLYDSYIRAIRWASDRIENEGVVTYVSNGGYIDGNTADGLRKSLADEFDVIYCYNLRGNQRTSGELSRKEGGKIFDSGSRNTVAVLILVKGIKSAEAAGGCTLYYRDIGDYRSRAEKLAIVGSQTLDTVDWERRVPNVHGDWINQRDELFASFQPLGVKSRNTASISLFETYSAGLQTNRDAWVYNYSAIRLRENVEAMVDFYNSQVNDFNVYCEERGITKPRDHVDGFIDLNPKKISWSRSLKGYVAKREKVEFAPEKVTSSVYRPFMKEAVYFDRHLNHERSQLPRLFPTPEHSNLGFYVNGFHATAEFALLAVDLIPCLDVFGKGGFFFSRYSYRERGADGDLFSAVEEGDPYERVDNITDAALRDYQKAYGDTAIAKDDVFYYAYGLLHSLEYRDRFAADLKKSLPRIPKVRDFKGFAEAGRKLADLHIDYEEAEPYGGIVENVSGDALGTPGRELYRVAKMKIPKVKGQPDRSTIVYNHRVTLTNIPEEAYRYQLGPRSAIEWIIDRYQVKIDKASEITNDANDWSDDPRYIIDLLKRIVTVSLETMKIVDALPALEILGDS
ncbi:DEAD/DEAH box helicase [Streptomyces montanisoli]|uniref:DEAD/DEAH box helicase n=1 Tax=Streptomyces montanisoli TaxID=2798581 RepID=A0A940MGG5_9ACTN|nr:type ISP restriction/modification enzyme [Streptomyces montanisoli]MBP0459590.1 DEAD/DEAH box helicase [Streptomyces montanisoli]